MLYTLDERQCRNLEVSSRAEWLLTNGIGGFAMGTASGINARRYHGHLVAAVTPPTERMVTLASIEAFLHPKEGLPVGISSHQYPGAVHPEGYLLLQSFTSGKYATWVYKSGKSIIEKRLGMHPGRNTVTVRYRNLSPKAVRLALKPLVSHKPYHQNFSEDPMYPKETMLESDRFALVHNGVPLSIAHMGAERLPVQGWYYRFEHARELERGLPPRDDLYCPVELMVQLAPEQAFNLVASTDGDIIPMAMDDEEQPGPFDLGEALKRSARHFLVEGGRRTSILAGYPWFTDWGRDTMIALPGICLCTGQVETARKILRDYAAAMKDGLIPNRFEDGGGLDYHTADATLWFAVAIGRTLDHQWDEAFAREMLEVLTELRDRHLEGTRFGIRIDPEDGLLTQGEAGLQLTWMDAKIGDWVVTPRQGKAVELNGLWIQGMRYAAKIAARLGVKDEGFAKSADQAQASFEGAFWDSELGYYRDTVDSAQFRPNQVIAMAMPDVELVPEHARQALARISAELVTPKGLRTLAPSDPDYVGEFKGPVSQLDAAYHQGTVWPWLLGCYVDASVRFGTGRPEIRRRMRELKHSMSEYGIGGIAEVYDGDPPQAPGGCPWQAWSVAELLRAWHQHLGSHAGEMEPPSQA